MSKKRITLLSAIATIFLCSTSFAPAYSFNENHQEQNASVAIIGKPITCPIWICSYFK